MKKLAEDLVRWGDEEELLCTPAISGLHLGKRSIEVRLMNEERRVKSREDSKRTCVPVHKLKRCSS